MQGRYAHYHRGGSSASPPQPRRLMEPEDDRSAPADEPAPPEEAGSPGTPADATGGDDAVLDLEELEQLQEEAERMKGLGNKHMAAQVSE